MAGEERERLWTRVVEADPSYAKYQERTQRLIPVLVLEPKGHRPGLESALPGESLKTPMTRDIDTTTHDNPQR